MTKLEWLQFIKDNREDFKDMIKRNLSAYDFSDQFENIVASSGATKWCLVDKQGDYVI